MSDEILKQTRPDYIKDKVVDAPTGTQTLGELSNTAQKNQIAVLASQLLDLGEKLDAAEKAKKEANAAWEAKEKELADLMESSDLDKFTAYGHTFFTQVEPKPSVTQENNEAFIEWLDNNGHGAIAKRAVHYQTLKAWVKNQMENAQTVPPTVSVFMKTNVRTRKLPSKK